MRRMFRTMLRRNKDSPEALTSIGFGARIGYWPCLKAPYIQLAFLFWRLDIWHGYASLEQFEAGDK